MSKKKVIYIIVAIIVLIIGIIVFINLFNLNKNRCGDNAFFEYDKKTHTVTIKGTGIAYLTAGWHYKFDMIDRGSSLFGDDYESVGELLFPLETEKIVISNGITGIGNKCGPNCMHIVEGGTYLNLKEIILPDSLKELEVGAFSNQTNLKTINIPNSITKIPDYAFYNCENLSKVVFPDGIKIIGNYAFYNCDKLYDINLTKSIRIIENYAFYECATLSELKLQNVRYIGGRAFEKCYNLKNVEIYGDIDQLYSYTFDSCLNLTNVKLTNNIKYISTDVWRHSKVLEEERLFSSREITRQFHPKDQDKTNIEELEKQVLNENYNNY